MTHIKRDIDMTHIESSRDMTHLSVNDVLGLIRLSLRGKVHEVWDVGSVIYTNRCKVWNSLVAGVEVAIQQYRFE